MKARMVKAVAAILVSMYCWACPVFADVFVSGIDSNDISRFNGTNGTFISTFASNSGLDHPRGLTIGPDNNFYVCSTSTHSILRYDGTTGAFLGPFISGGSLVLPQDIILGPDGYFYVTTEAGTSPDQVLRYDQNGTYIGIAAHYSDLAVPRSIVFTPDNYSLVVTSGNNSKVLFYNPEDGQLRYEVSTSGSGLINPRGVTFGPDGHLYVASRDTNKILRFSRISPQFMDVFAEGGGLDGPQGITFGPDGHLYVCNVNADNVLKYNGSSGRFIEVFTKGTHPMESPSDLIFSGLSGLQPQIAAGAGYTVGLKPEGTVVAEGYSPNGEIDVRTWKGIIQIATGYQHTLGLKSDGTVLATGRNDDGQCNVGDWIEIRHVAAGYWHALGLKKSGPHHSEVVAVGKNDYGQCNVSSWNTLLMQQLAGGKYHSVGLSLNGWVEAVGDNTDGQLNVTNRDTWKNIIQIAAGEYHTVGLRADGTVVATGRNNYGQTNVGSWTDIVWIAAGANYTLGRKADGTVLAVGDNGQGQCNVSGWTDMVQVVAGPYHSVGMKADGTIAAVGEESPHSYISDILEWNFRKPKDMDGDGIDDDIDYIHLASWTIFSDEHAGTTWGDILDYGDQALTVEDAEDLSLGVVIRASDGGGPNPAAVRALGTSTEQYRGSVDYEIDAGDELIITCDSVRTQAVKGTIGMKLYGPEPDAVLGEMDLAAGYEVVYYGGSETEPATIAAAATNPGPVVVFVNGTPTSVEPGETEVMSALPVPALSLGGILALVLLLTGVAGLTMRSEGCMPRTTQGCD